MFTKIFSASLLIIAVSHLACVPRKNNDSASVQNVDEVVGTLPSRVLAEVVFKDGTAAMVALKFDRERDAKKVLGTQNGAVQALGSAHVTLQRGSGVLKDIEAGIFGVSSGNSLNLSLMAQGQPLMTLKMVRHQPGTFIQIGFIFSSKDWQLSAEDNDVSWVASGAVKGRVENAIVEMAAGESQDRPFQCARAFTQTAVYKNADIASKLSADETAELEKLEKAKANDDEEPKLVDNFVKAQFKIVCKILASEALGRIKKTIPASSAAMK